MKRFNGREVWDALAPESQADIGAAALELAVTWHGLEKAKARNLLRPLEHAEPLLIQDLREAVSVAMPKEIGSAVRIPGILGGVCRKCGCTRNDACAGGCGWAEDDLCTACVK